AIQLRHLDVEKQQIRFELAYSAYCLSAIARFGHHLDVAMRSQQLPDAAAGEWLVIDDDGANLIHRYSFSSEGERESERSQPRRLHQRSQRRECLRLQRVFQDGLGCCSGQLQYRTLGNILVHRPARSISGYRPIARRKLQWSLRPRAWRFRA